MFSVLQSFSTVLRKDAEQRGLNVEVFDLANIDPEERLLEEVCCLCLCTFSYLQVVQI